MTTTEIQTRILNGFDDPSFSPEQWNTLLQQGGTRTVNLTPEWQRGWWDTFGQGRLLLTVAECEGHPTALGPLFSNGGMIFNICPEDGLDFIGNISEPGVLDALLQTARQQVPDFAGFRFYFIPDHSPTGRHLQSAAARLGLECFDEGALPSPWIDLAGQPAHALACTRKKSLLRHERHLARHGTLTVEHLRTAAEIEPHLDAFFAQHRARRAATPHPSLFESADQQAYYRSITTRIGPRNWLRFTRIVWNDQPAAFHFGLCHEGRFLWGIPSFDIQLAHLSPGEVLLRQTLLAAIEEGAALFDFGVGAEPYKDRFATHATQLRTWGLYPKGGTP